MRFGLIICLLIQQFISAAQQKVSFIINTLPAYHKVGDSIFIAGSFNNWNPHDSRFVLKKTGGKHGITIELPPGMFEYKFTRGSWDQVETLEGGWPGANRIVRIPGEDTVSVDIPHWSDHFPKQAKKSTASSNVHIVDSVFYMPQLKRHRRIWIYLPSDYTTSRKKYPVLYMHDGQNVFDEATSSFGEWGVDEALDTLGPQHRQMIVVGIDNGGDKRLNEYAPYDMEKYGKGEGALYVEFIVKTLKPFIDKHYRTKKCKDHTSIAGSSMGGLISFYAILNYPKVFGAAGVFSPAFWINPQLKQIEARQAKKVKGKIYFYAGQQEGDSMVPDMLHVFEQMQQHSKAKMETVIRGEGRHDEPTWRAEFVEFYRWLIE